MDILERAKAAMIRPDNFAYFGDLDGSVWGRAFGQSRDSDALERSNFEVITGDLLKRFPDDYVIERSNHWAVGWVDEGRIRVLKNPRKRLTEKNLTEAFRAVVAWKEKLENYPVADEEHYSALEFGEFSEYVTSEAKWYFAKVRTWNSSADDMPDDFPEKLLSALSEEYSRVDDLSGEAMLRATREILS